MNIRWISLLILAGLSQSNAALGLSFSESQFLLTRTGFTPAFSEVESQFVLSKKAAIQQLLDGAQNPDGQNPTAAFTQIQPMPSKQAQPDERQRYRRAQAENTFAMQQWWLDRMITTTTPFAEQLTLFWHNHFVSSAQKVKHPALMYQQNQLYREQALGNYRTLVQAMAKEPAMIIYLDNQTNRKGQPNENFARELFELFTLGEGHYEESDIKEAARAFTGWQVNRKTGAFFVNARDHDQGLKTVFEQTGNFDGDDVINLLFTEKPTQVATHLVTKLWMQFVSPEPVEAEVDRLAKIFINNDFELRPLMEALLLSDYFWSNSQPVLVKSPVDLVVGTQRLFGLNVTEKSLIRQMGQQLEQRLFAPPNVKGWPGGNDWISSSTLLARAQLMGQVTRSLGGMAGKAGQKLPSGYRNHLDHSLEEWQRLLLPHGAVAPVAKPDIDMQQTNQFISAIAAMLEDPMYQLK